MEKQKKAEKYFHRSSSIPYPLVNMTKESGTEIGNSLEFDFVVPPPHS